MGKARSSLVIPSCSFPRAHWCPKPFRQFRGGLGNGCAHMRSSWGYYLIFHHHLPLPGEPEEGCESPQRRMDGKGVCGYSPGRLRAPLPINSSRSSKSHWLPIVLLVDGPGVLAQTGEQIALQDSEALLGCHLSPAC